MHILSFFWLLNGWLRYDGVHLVLLDYLVLHGGGVSVLSLAILLILFNNLQSARRIIDKQLRSRGCGVVPVHWGRRRRVRRLLLFL